LGFRESKVFSVVILPAAPQRWERSRKRSSYLFSKGYPPVSLNGQDARWPRSQDGCAAATPGSQELARPCSRWNYHRHKLDGFKPSSFHFAILSGGRPPRTISRCFSGARCSLAPTASMAVLDMFE